VSDRSAKLLLEAAENPKPAQARGAMRVERASKAIEEMAERCGNAPGYRCRIAGWPIAGPQKLVVWMAKPPWWNLVARWKWRKLARNMCKPQPGLSGWTVIDCRNAPGRLSDVVYVPEEARYGWDKATKSPGDRETGKEK
jgi:hypothetical protein